MSAIERVLAYIQANPGTSSSEISDSNPDLNRGTVTSAVSKLKRKGVILFQDSTSRTEPDRLFPIASQNVVAFTKPTAEPKATKVAPEPISSAQQPVDLARILKVLSPFADYAKTLQEKGIEGHPYVLLSGTTKTAHVVTADGHWFLDALSLVTDLKRAEK